MLLGTMTIIPKNSRESAQAIFLSKACAALRPLDSEAQLGHEVSTKRSKQAGIGLQAKNGCKVSHRQRSTFHIASDLPIPLSPFGLACQLRSSLEAEVP